MSEEQESPIKRAVRVETDKLIETIGSGARVIEEINVLHGRQAFKTPAMLYQYRAGLRDPSSYFLWFIWKRAAENHPLRGWAYNILQAMNEIGEGLPLE